MTARVDELVTFIVCLGVLLGLVGSLPVILSELQRRRNLRRHRRKRQ